MKARSPKDYKRSRLPLAILLAANPMRSIKDVFSREGLLDKAAARGRRAAYRMMFLLYKFFDFFVQTRDK